jgi:2-dehydropantoate 2-reductase
MTVEEPTVALIGPGAIGTTIAAALHEVGRTPLVCGRRAHPQLSLRFDGGNIVVPGPVLTEPASVAAPYDLVFVAVKATQIAAIAPWLQALCHDRTVVCVLQNGVEQKTLFAPYVAEADVLPSVVWFPAQREPEASVWLRAKPRLTLPDVEGPSGCGTRYGTRAVKWISARIFSPLRGVNCCRMRSPV